MRLATIPKTVKLWGRGQLTLPIEVRQALGLETDSTLTVFQAGEAIILTPKKLLRPGLSKAMEKEMKKQDLSLQDLLKELGRQRSRYTQERRGTRHR
jgi:bifunctional DNA-binding transcriptional regulator/antitoxin component of YhaV-PrlF toxin-antitoxin module